MPGFVAACTYRCNRDAILLVCFLPLVWAWVGPTTPLAQMDLLLHLLGQMHTKPCDEGSQLLLQISHINKVEIVRDRCRFQFSLFISFCLLSGFHGVSLNILPSLHRPLVLTCSPPGLQIQPNTSHRSKSLM